ncbi:MAG: cyclic-di-AMP receptor [Ileibacterium sp.]|nr:cyclic-di-AMP receptor [Ileibacterium sp.]
MKLLIAMISPDDVNAVCAALTKSRFGVRHIATSRAFLEAGTATLLISAKDEKVEEALRILKESAGVHQRRTDSYDSIQPMTEEGGGCVFVVNAEQFVVL